MKWVIGIVAVLVVVCGGLCAGGGLWWYVTNSASEVPLPTEVMPEVAPPPVVVPVPVAPPLPPVPVDVVALPPVPAPLPSPLVAAGSDFLQLVAEPTAAHSASAPRKRTPLDRDIASLRRRPTGAKGGRPLPPPKGLSRRALPRPPHRSTVARRSPRFQSGRVTGDEETPSPRHSGKASWMSFDATPAPVKYIFLQLPVGTARASCG